MCDKKSQVRRGLALSRDAASPDSIESFEVHPIKRKDAEPISAVLEQTQEMLKGSPPPFLRKILGRDEKPSFLDEEDEYEGTA